MRPQAANVLLAAGVLAAAVSVCYSRSRPAPDAIAPEDAELQRQEAALADATPGAVAALESQLAAACARLPTAGAVDSLLEGETPNWIVETRSAESFPTIEMRHYGLVFDHPRMGSWPAILATIKTLCAQPGLTIDSLELIAAPEPDGSFQQVAVKFTVLLQT